MGAGEGTSASGGGEAETGTVGPGMAAGTFSAEGAGDAPGAGGVLAGLSLAALRIASRSFVYCRRASTCARLNGGTTLGTFTVSPSLSASRFLGALIFRRKSTPTW